MSKLTEIVDAATGEDVPIPSLLRKVQVVAARIDAPELIDWVEHELAGYPSGAAVPSYRGPFTTQVSSVWSGPVSIAKNVPIPPSACPEWLRDVGAFEVIFSQSASELERLAQSDGVLSFAWPTDAVGRLNGDMRGGHLKQLQRIAPLHGLVSAHRLVTPALVESVLDQVRTRVLTLALKLEKIEPEVGERGVTVGDTTAVIQILNTFVYGNGNKVAVASPNSHQVDAVVAGDLHSLLTAAAALGLAPEEVAELGQAVKDDQADAATSAGRPGSRVTRFLGRAVVGGLKSASQATIQEGAKLLGELVQHYYGIGS